MGLGFFASIIIGGFAGWFAQMFMNSSGGIIFNIILGVVGAALANWALGWFGVSFGGAWGYLVAGFIGSCALIAIGRAIR
ncbi:GlsB/YeaQ/YmgE family stress response membrane protein [Bartonella sp. HY329]|uniref:GlsB/YeaQ/YmgE family stress response membrane protein n=1 Tax=unclassified Bartonella TaxID=2645622 RepID=UPI0021C68465|nr:MULTISPECIES: GlsB/YeaQ/YmgE family stress response membrane protein [unclassified Bartonella]UXM94654.1 GlsB/YeaQ/YmgE family stress response membrane protein [Bartonella sp. HY329]UXN08977.1 GlsB/YeaQ/YmgE family stress response membrane protein [Bartonella sp. HY328]